MGLIDYGTYRAPDASQGIGALGDAILAVADRRRRMLEQEQELAQRKADFASNEKYKQDQIAAQRYATEEATRRQAAKLEADRQKTEAENARRQREGAAKALPDIYSRIDQGDEQAAHGIAAAHGGQLGRMALSSVLGPAPQRDYKQFPDRPEGVPAEPGIEPLPLELDMQRQQHERQMTEAIMHNLGEDERIDADTAKREEMQKQLDANPVYELMFPGGLKTYRSRDAATNARLLRGEQMAARIQEQIGPLAAKSRFGQEALDYAVSRAKSGTLDEKGEDPYKTYVDRLQFLEAQAGSEKRARMTGARSITPAQKADDERSNVNAFDAAYSRWEKSKNVDDLTKAYDKVSELKSAAAAYRRTGDVINQRNALYTAARAITGPGILTQQEYDNTVQKTSGITAALLSKLRREESGKISEAEWAAMEKFVVNADIALRSRAIDMVRNYDIRFGAKTYHAKASPGEVTAIRESLMDRLGLTDADLPGKKKGKAAAVDVDALDAEADALLKGGAK